MLSCTYNTPGFCWHSKGSDTSILLLFHPLCLQAIQKRSHHYEPRDDFVSGVDNSSYNRPSFSRYITDAAMLAHMDALHPQDLQWRMWTPPSKLISVIASEMRRTTSPMVSLLVNPPPLMGTRQSDPSYVNTWPSTHYSSCTRIRSLSLTPLQGNTVQEPLPPADVK